MIEIRPLAEPRSGVADARKNHAQEGKCTKMYIRSEHGFDDAEGCQS
jgi:hypothetical protein